MYSGLKGISLLSRRQKQSRISSDTGYTLKLWIIGLPLLWTVVGLIEVFSASRFRAEELRGDPTYFFQLDLVWRILGIIIFFLVSRVSLNTLKKLARPLYLLNIVLLVLVLFTDPINGARRWFSLGPINIHPLEILKFTIILVLGLQIEEIFRKGCSNYKEHLHQHLKKLGYTVIFPVLLVVLQPDLSGAGIIVLISFLMYLFLASDRYKIKDLFYAVLLGGLLSILLVAFVPYRLQRFKVYLNLLFKGQVVDIFGAGNQIYHILIGISRGGLWGVGLGQSRQQAGYLVETTAFTDSISAVIFEEFGFILGGLFVFSYFYWYRKILQLLGSLHADRFTYNILFGLATLIILQAWIHFAVNLALLPITGVTLPFVSYGGSSLIINFVMLGVIKRVLDEKIKALL